MEEGHKPGSEERQKSVYFCRKVSAFVDSDVCKARTTKVTCVERVVFKLHKARLGMNLVSGSAEMERRCILVFGNYIQRRRGSFANARR